MTKPDSLKSSLCTGPPKLKNKNPTSLVTADCGSIRSHLPPIPRSFNFSRAVHKHFCFFSQFYTDPDSVLMGFRIPSIVLHAKQILKLQRNQSSVLKGHIAVYVGEVQRKRFVVPIALLNHPSLVDLLNRAKEEFGYHHPMGGLTIPCEEEAFIVLASSLNAY